MPVPSDAGAEVEVLPSPGEEPPSPDSAQATPPPAATAALTPAATAPAPSQDAHLRPPPLLLDRFLLRSGFDGLLAAMPSPFMGRSNAV